MEHITPLSAEPLPHCEFGFDPAEDKAEIKLPSGRLIQLYRIDYEEPDTHHTYLRGLSVDDDALVKVHLIDQNGSLTVSSVTINGETVFTQPTLH